MQCKMNSALNFDKISHMSNLVHTKKQIFLIGLSIYQSSIDVREKIQNLFCRLPNKKQFCKQYEIYAVVPIFTCHRVEWFIMSSSIEPFKHWLFDQIQDEKQVYTHEGKDAIRHILQVACGLDSIVVGESPVLGQIREALKEAKDNDWPIKGIDSLMQNILSKAKYIRANSGLNEKSYSLFKAVLFAVSQVFTDLSRKKILVVGAGNIGQMCVSRMVDKGAEAITVLNRNPESLEVFKHQENVRTDLLENLGKWVGWADLVILATSAPELVLKQEQVPSKDGDGKLRVFIDLAVPRNIDLKIRDIPDTFLFDMDDISHIYQRLQLDRSKVIQRANDLLIPMLDEIYSQNLVKMNADTITHFRQQMQLLKESSIQEVTQAVEKGEDLEQVLENVFTKLIKQAMHKPTRILRQAAKEQNKELVDGIKSIVMEEEQ